MDKRNVLAIVGSNRKKSVNESILWILGALFEEAINLKIYHGIDRLPHFNPDISDEEVSVEVSQFRAEIATADGVIICTPEYVFSVPGSLKNALEWTVSTTVFSNKPAAIIVASGLGEKTFDSLKLIMTTLGVRMDDEAAILIQGARAKIQPDKNFDELSLSQISRLMDSFLKCMSTT
jgi:NAD(P)H-dependent FMN reductase